MAGFLIDEGTLVGYEGEESEVIIPDCVKAIDGYAFSGNKMKMLLHFSVRDGIIDAETERKEGHDRCVRKTKPC